MKTVCFNPKSEEFQNIVKASGLSFFQVHFLLSNYWQNKEQLGSVLPEREVLQNLIRSGYKEFKKSTMPLTVIEAINSLYPTPTQAAPVEVQREEPIIQQNTPSNQSSDLPKFFNKQDKELKKGSVVEYNGKKYLFWNNNNGKAQLINTDGTKFSGTPNIDKLAILGSYKTVLYNNIEYIVTDNNNIYSGATGNLVYTGTDNSSITQKNAIINKATQEQGSPTNKKTINVYWGQAESETSTNSLASYTNYSGGAAGADTIWEKIGKEFGLGKQVNYRPETLQRLTKEQLQEVENAYQQAVIDLGRTPLSAASYAGGLVRRDYLQAKAADEIFAIGTIIAPNKKDSKGYINNTNETKVAGGTGYAVQMALNLGKKVHVFDQIDKKWYYANPQPNGVQWVLEETPVLSKKFAGIGTREINEAGKQAIREVYENTIKSTSTINTNTSLLNSGNINNIVVQTSIPQNLVSGIESFGTKQEANAKAKELLGSNPHSIDMIEAGIRTRTTRSVGEMEKYNIKVGDIVKQFGKSSDGSTKTILTKITAIYPKGTPEFINTWYKEGWTQEGVEAIKRYKDGAAAIEFEVILDQKNDSPQKQQITETNSKNSNRIQQVTELFDSTPELANQVYTTLGIKNNKIEILKSDYTRQSVQQDTDSLYLFTDNAERTSRPTATVENVDKNGWYYKKYKSQTNKPIHFGSLNNPSSAVMRGLNNAYPISTMSAFGTDWTDANFDLFKTTIDDEINQIKEDLPKFSKIKISNSRIGQGGKFASLPEQHQAYLDSKLLEIGIDNTGDKPKILNIEGFNITSNESAINSEEVEKIKNDIKNLRNDDGNIPDNKINIFRKLQKKLKFLQNNLLNNINNAITEFIETNKLSESDARYFRKLATIRDNFSELVEDFNEAKDTNYTITDIMSFFNKDINLQETIKNESEKNVNKNQEYEKKLLQENNFEADKDYTANELDYFVQQHGSKQVKFIWNIIKAVAQKLGVTTRFMLDGTHKIPQYSAGHYLNGQIENRASLFDNPSQMARIIVHELVHGVTTYILKAVEQNNTKILSKLTARQLKAVDKLNTLFNELKKDKEFDDTYGTKNTHELLAELTNESFVEKLKAKNIFEKILEAVFEIFGISFNAYNESIKILEDLISNPIIDNRYEGSLAGGYSLYSQYNQITPQQKQETFSKSAIKQGVLEFNNKKLLQETGSLSTISKAKIDNLQSTVEYQLLNEKDENLYKKVGQSYIFLSEKDAERFTYLVEKHKEFPKEFKVTKKLTKYERDSKNPLKFNGYNEYTDFYYVKSNKNKKSNLYDIVNKETGEVIASKIRVLSVSKDIKSEIAKKYGLEHTPTKIFSANRSIAFALYRQKPSKAKYIAQAKRYLYDAIKFLKPEETNLKINLDKIEELLNSFPEEMWDYINTTYSPEDSTNINASISLQNQIKFKLPKLGFLQEIEKITGIPLQGVSFKNYDRSGSLAKVFRYSKLDGNWGDTITIDNSMTTKELKASIRYYLSTKKIFRQTSEEENVRKYAEHRGIDYDELRELVFGDIDKALDNIAYNGTGNSDTIELSKWRESIRNYDWQSAELFSKPYENFQNTVKERITAKFKDKNLSNDISHLEYFFNSGSFNWLNINFNNISGQYYMADMETEANVGISTKMGGIINPFEMKIYQKPKAGENFLQEKEVFNRLAAILHEPFHALHALSYGTKEELELRKAFDNLYRTDFGKEMMNQVFGSGYNKGQQVPYDTLYKEFTAFSTQLMLYPKQWIKDTDLRSNDIYEFIEKIQTLQDKTYEEIVKTQQKIGTVEKVVTEEEKIKLSYLEKLYNYLVKALNKVIPLSKKFTNLIADSKLVEKQVREDVFGTVEETITKTLKLPDNVKKSKEEFLQAMEELQSAINTLMQIDGKLFSSDNISNFFTSNKFNQEKGSLSNFLGSKQDIEGFKKFVNNKTTDIHNQEISNFQNQQQTENTFDKELAQKIQEILEKLYPELKLIFTNNPIWEKGGNIHNQKEFNNQVNYRLKATEKILDNLTKIKQWESNKSIDKNILWKKISELGIPKQQLELLKESDGNTIEEKLTSFVVNYSYTVEVNIAMLTEGSPHARNENEYPTFEYNGNYFARQGGYFIKATSATFDDSEIIFTDEYFEALEKSGITTSPSKYYSSLTVPGGINYTENEFKTPNITPSIKGHAQFATENGIGWFRSDDKVSEQKKEFSDLLNKNKIEDADRLNELRKTKDLPTKIRRILEIQSDWGQKLRLRFVLDGNTHYIEETKQGKKYWINRKEVNSNTYNKAFDDFINRGEIIKGGTPEQIAFARLIVRNWDEFSIKAIIQDSVKKGYEKVLFPSGNTASRVEGHTTLEEFKKKNEDRIKELEDFKKVQVENDKKRQKIINKNYPLHTNLVLSDALDGVIFNGTNFILRETNWVDNNIYTERIISKEEAEKRISLGLKAENIIPIESINDEINQLKEELEGVETEGFAALRPIYNFYENTVTNILNKIYGKENVKVITDEYGNTWNEITINQARDLANILLQHNEANQIIGQANIKALTILIDAIRQKQDTLPHEFAHHYIAWYRDTPIVQEAIKKWGSEEALVQSIGEQVVKQRGEAYNWWKSFVKWIMDKFNSLSKLQKEELTQILTDALLTRQDLSKFSEDTKDTKDEKYQQIEKLFEENSEVANAVYEAAGLTSSNFEFKENKKAFGNSPKFNDKQKQQAIELYSQYLDTIFPDSKVKDIVYHGSRGGEKFEIFKFTGIDKLSAHVKAEDNTGIFFTDDPFIAATYGDGTFAGNYRVLLNIKNPIYPITETVTSGSVGKYIGKYDGVIGQEPDHSGTNIVVFEPEQVHILGSKQDIEGFKKFIKNKSQNYPIFVVDSSAIDTALGNVIESNGEAKKYNDNLKECM